MIGKNYAFSMKSSEEKEIYIQANCFAGGYLDVIKHQLVYGTQAIQCETIRVILVIAKLNRFDPWIDEFKLTYIQSGKPLSRKIFITITAPVFE